MNYADKYRQVEIRHFSPMPDSNPYECLTCWALVDRSSRYLHWQWHTSIATQGEPQ